MAGAIPSGWSGLSGSLDILSEFALMRAGSGSGRTGLTPRGPFDPTATDYVPGDAVSDGGITYVCIVAPSGLTDVRGDTFVRADDPDGWGSATGDGGAGTWGIQLGTPSPGTAAIVNHQGVINLSAGNPSVLEEMLSGVLESTRVRYQLRATTTTEAANDDFYLLLDSRVADGPDAPYIFGTFRRDGSLYTQAQNVAGTSTAAGSWSGAAEGQPFWAEIDLRGSAVSLRAWLDGSPRPDDAQASWPWTGDFASAQVAVALVSNGVGTATIDALSVVTTPRPSANPDHWALLAAAPAGTPTLIGPMVVDFSDIPTDGSTMTLWTPEVGDHILRIYPNTTDVTQWDYGDLYLVQGTPMVTDHIPDEFLAYSVVGSIGNNYNSSLDSLVAAAEGSAVRNGLTLTTAWVCTSTDPIGVYFRNDSDPTPTHGHVELYALVCRPVAP